MRRFPFRVLFFTFLSFALVYAEPQINENTQEIIQQIKDKSEKINSYSVDTVIILKERDTEKVYKGKKIFRKPDAKSVLFDTDKTLIFSTILRSGKVWQYFPLDNAVFYIDWKNIENKFGGDSLFGFCDDEDLTGGRIFDNIRNLRYEGIEEIDGKKMYILKGEAINKTQLFGLGRGGQDFYAKDIIMWIGVGDGLLYRREQEDKLAKIKFTEIYSIFLLDIPIQDKEFEFVVPKDVNFVDRTQEIENTFLTKSRLFEQNQQARNYIDQAIIYVNNNQLGKTIEILKEAIELFPDNAELHYNLGTGYYHKQLYKEAIEELKKVIEIEPYYSAAYYNLGLSYCGIRLFDEAIMEFNKAIEIDPNDYIAYTNLSSAYNGKGLYDKAIEFAKKAIDINSLYAPAYNNLGAAYYHKGLIDDAIAMFKKSSELDPNLADPRLGLGSSLASKGLYEEAIDEFNKAIEISPNFAPANYSLGLIYLNKGSFDKAIDFFKKVIDISPEYQEAYAKIGWIYKYKGMHEEAIKYYKKALELNPNDDWSHSNLAVVYESVNNVEEAKKELAIAIKIFREKGKEDLAKSAESYLEQLKIHSQQD